MVIEVETASLDIVRHIAKCYLMRLEEHVTREDRPQCYLRIDDARVGLCMELQRRPRPSISMLTFR